MVDVRKHTLANLKNSLLRKQQNLFSLSKVKALLCLMAHYLYEARLTATEWAMPYFLQCAEGVHRENNSISMGKRKSLVSNQVAFWSSITTVVLKNSGHPGACPAGLRR